jgi:DNA-directed RNA polymerase subunit RPC12/RpoP
MNTGKTIGLVLIAAGIVVAVVGTIFVGATYAGGQTETLGGLALGIGCAIVLAVPLIGVGVFLLIRGQREAAEFAEVEKERKLLGMVQAQGQVRISDVVLELDATRDRVKGWIYDLVHKGLFAGYINWDEGTLYSRDASQLRGHNCPNCGGEVELAGKGVVQCPYCGAEIFLTE